MATTTFPCCQLTFKCVECPIITGADCVPPNNLMTGQMWFNPCTCTYYFQCGDETDINSCGGYTPLNFKPGAGIQYSGDCVLGHFISVKIEQGGGLGFNENGELKIVQQYVPPQKLKAKLEWIASEPTNANRFVNGTQFVGSPGIGITNTRNYPIVILEEAEFTEVAIKGNDFTVGLTRCGAKLERSTNAGATWGINCTAGVNPWIETPRSQTEVGGGYGMRFITLLPGQSHTVNYRITRVIQKLVEPNAQPEVWYAHVLATLIEL